MSRQEATPASRLSQGRVIIESLGVYLPAGSVSTAELVRGCRSRVLLPLERLTGIRSRHVAAPDEFCIDIAAAAVRDCLAGSRHKADEIDLLISCSIDHCEGPQHRHSLEPNTSLQLRERLALANATAFDVSNGCAGMFTGIKVAEAFLKAGTSCCALVVSGEFISHLATTAQREISTLDDQRLACLTLGDAGAAVILEMSEDGEAGFESIDMHTVSKYSSYCIAKPSREPEGGVIMLTDAIRLSTTTVEHAIPHAAAALRRLDWRVDDLQHVIVHQTSRMSIQQAAQRISAFLGQRLPQSVNIADILEDHGNTATTSHFVALYDLMEKSRLHSGDRVLFSTTGSGLTIGTALYTFDDMPERGRARRTSVNGSASSRPRSASESSNGNHKGAGLAGVRIETVATASANASTDWGTALARRAAEDCMANSSHGSGEIALLVHCGVYRPEYMFEPAMAAMLADELHLNEEPLTEDSPRTLAFDVYNSSIGF
ncbi:MAG TPA: 3-oxoacyl-[acyl-carrier-protein] synthase III C-terminal domain-containing protein, partial [Candidatus Sulfotelmatobacter sp.]|nr:3-oxoacyl-[acyl-carrier-protein] synthase III C-terminal domain-containing protein [Candidatus Sulfotelmatobacter sp.]